MVANNSLSASIQAENLLNAGIALHRDGNLFAAKSLYEQLLGIDDKNIAAAQLLVLVYSSRGEPGNALKLIDHALKVDVSNAASHHLKGNVMVALERATESLNSYDQAISLKSDDATFYKDRGIARYECGLEHDAMSDFKKAIELNPADSSLFNYLEMILRFAQNLHKAGNLCSAGELYQDILLINPNHPEALKLLATLYSAQGRHAEAENLFNASLNQCSTDPVTFSNRGSNRSSLDRLIEAIEDFDTAIALKPDYLLAHFNKGNVYRKLGDLQDARRCYDRVLAIDPHYASALYNLGNTCHDLGEYEDALIYYQRALAVESTRAGAALGCGLAQHRLGFLEQALQSYDRALELDPDYPEAHWNRALLYLLSGDYPRGWPLYEWRLSLDANKERYPPNTKASWRGDYDISDKRLFIPAEQGLGDLIQFCRYAPLLNDIALEVIVEAPRALRPLLESLCPKIRLSVKEEGSPDFDVVCPVMSLPYAFNTTLETIPSAEKYLSTEPAKVSIWRERLGTKQKKRIGVVWSGAPAHKDDSNRSINLGELVSIMDDSFEWHSLQKDYRPDDWDVLENSPQIRQHQEDLQDFSDTAALIECMDLVITVDTSVAHLAGALGKPVWIMLSKLPDFRWLLGREDSPWYASARLYRQEEKGDWASVLSAVATSLPRANIST